MRDGRLKEKMQKQLLIEYINRLVMRGVEIQ